MSNLPDFEDLLAGAPGHEYDAEAHLEYAGKMLASGNRTMADRIHSGVGAHSAPFEFDIANAHIAYAQARMMERGLDCSVS